MFSPLEEKRTEPAEHHFGFWPTGPQPSQTHPCQRPYKVAVHGAARPQEYYAPRDYLPLLECKPGKKHENTKGENF